MTKWSNWIKHAGGAERPVDGNTLVIVEYANGQILRVSACHTAWDRVAQYCIEVKSERETVVMYGCLVDLSGAWGFDGSELFEQPNTHIITFETEDGEPVLDSIKMEQL